MDIIVFALLFFCLGFLCGMRVARRCLCSSFSSLPCVKNSGLSGILKT